MPAGELDGGTPRPFRGFNSYADDTPRDLQGDPPLDEAEPEFDTFQPAHDELTFAPREDWDEPTAPSRRFGRTAGVALLVVLAAGLGFAVTRGGWTSKAPPPPSVAPPVLRAEVARPPPVGTRLEAAAVLEAPAPNLAPSKLLQRDRAPTATPSPTPPVRIAQGAKPPPRFIDPEVSSNASVSMPAPAAVVAPPTTAPAPALAPIRPSFDCQEARTPAQQMICNDPRLAAADRRMSRAYAAALAAGGSEDELRSEQSDWLEIREDAARYSNRAVLNIYEQRTRELEAISEQKPR